MSAILYMPQCVDFQVSGSAFDYMTGCKIRPSNTGPIYKQDL